MGEMQSNQTKQNHIYLIYMYKEELALDILQWVLPNQNKLNNSVALLVELRITLSPPEG